MSTNYYVPKRSRIYKYTNLCDPFIGEDGKYHFLYKIINTCNGKYYIGIHSTDNLLDGYSGSGKALINSIRKWGPHKFEKYVLKYCKNREDLIKEETIYVSINEVNDPNCYNLVLGGNSYIDLNQVSIRQKGSVYVYNKSINKRARIQPESLELYLSNGWEKGYGPIPEAVKNSGNRGKKAIHDAHGKNKWVDECDIEYFIKNGWELGTGCQVNKDKIYIHKNRNDRNWPDRKLIYPIELQKYLGEGWEEGYGEASDILKKGTITGKIYVTKNKKTKTIDPEELDDYIENGWQKGVVGFEHHKALVGRKRMYNPATNESVIVESSLQQQYLDTGWKYGMGKRAKNKTKQCFVFKDDKYKKIDIELLDVYIKDGWIKSHPAKGSIQVNKNGKNKMIFQKDLQQYLDDGWELGIRSKQNK